MRINVELVTGRQETRRGGRNMAIYRRAAAECSVSSAPVVAAIMSRLRMCTGVSEATVFEGMITVCVSPRLLWWALWRLPRIINEAERAVAQISREQARVATA